MALPAEVICHILTFLGLRDIVLLRTVSKQFRDITYDATLWRILYANACVPRPPGPFPFQSAQFLERTLVKSARLARSWTTQPMRYLSSECISLGGVSMSTPKTINNWLIACESSKRFVMHDLDSDTVPHFQQVLWEHDGEINQWAACSVTSIEGPVLCILFSELFDEDLTFVCYVIKLLEFRVDPDSGNLYHSLSLDVPTKHIMQPESLYGSHGPFCRVGSQDVIFDVETQRFYEFPSFISTLSVERSATSVPLFSPMRGRVTLLAKTHIFTLQGVSHNGRMCTLVQAFTLSIDACAVRDGTSVLPLSHEGIIDGLPDAINIIRNSTIDRVSGATNVRLLTQSLHRMNMHLSCVDLTLPKHTPANKNAVLPMTIDAHDILQVQDILYDNTYGYNPDWSFQLEFSDDGYARGLWWRRTTDEPSRFPAIDEGSVLRITIDASQERCTGVLGELSLPENADSILHPHYIHSTLDACRGKVCYNKEWSSAQDEQEHVVVVEFE